MTFIFSSILLLKINGPITPSVSNYIKRELKDRYDFCIIEMDTPGGLDKSMREIVKAIINSKIPVVGYVYPRGARCASAGVFILTACHISAMAPGTSIGAAHPVVIGGEKMDPDMKKKVENDAVSYILSLAEMRHRNREWLARSVRESITATAFEAESLHVVDMVAGDIKELLDKLRDRKVKIGNKEFILRGDVEDIKERGKNLIDKILDIITQPEIAYLLLLLGIYGLIMEFKNPGAVFPGVLGGIAIILALYSLHLLPVNYAGLLLIILGIVMLVLEAHITSYGLLTVGGVFSFILGSFMLFPERRLPMSIIVGMVIVLLVFAFIIYLIVKAHKRHPMTGMKGMLGETGVVRKPLDPEGLIFIHGELWRAESITGERIEEGEKVEVVSTEGLCLKVRRKTKK